MIQEFLAQTFVQTIICEVTILCVITGVLVILTLFVCDLIDLLRGIKRRRK